MTDNTQTEYTHTYDPSTRLWTETATNWKQALMPLSAVVSHDDYNAYIKQQDNRWGDQYLCDVATKAGEMNK